MIKFREYDINKFIDKSNENKILYHTNPEFCSIIKLLSSGIEKQELLNIIKSLCLQNAQLKSALSESKVKKPTASIDPYVNSILSYIKGWNTNE